jgi:hypothetical protein
MEATMRRLCDVYRQERESYYEILDHVQKQRTLIESGASYAEINRELALKRDILIEIEHLEKGIHTDRELWRRHKHTLDSAMTETLMGLLTDVSSLVEVILERERENEVLLTSRRRNRVRTGVGIRNAAAAYRTQSLVEVER